MLVFYLVNIFKKLKTFRSWNSFLTTTAECSFKCFNTQCPHPLFKLKHFIFILSTAFKTILITKKHPLWPYLALYMSLSWCTLFIKATPTNYRICQNLFNQSQRLLITSLVINSLGGRHTHILTSWTKAISRN